MGEVKDVANGYARNYLLPRGYAAPATPTFLGRAEELARIEGEQQRVQDEHASGLVGKLAGETLVMSVRVGEQGRLYGSVTSVDIAEKAGEILGEELDRRRVLLPEVIREVGLSTVQIRLSQSVTAEVQVAVVDAEAPEGVEAAVQQLLAPPVEASAPAEESAAEDGAAATAAAVDALDEPPTEGVSEPDKQGEETDGEATDGGATAPPPAAPPPAAPASDASADRDDATATASASDGATGEAGPPA